MYPVELFKNLADDTRLKSLLLIQREGELCVCELVCALDLSQPKISRHLAQLRKAGILTGRKEGQWVYYSFDPSLSPWARGVIDAALQEHEGYLSPCYEALGKMADRPEAKRTCC